MKKLCVISVCSLFLFMSHCTGIGGLELGICCSGKIFDEENKGVDSAKVEIVAIKAVGHPSADSYIGKYDYSDENGNYRLILPPGVEWEQNTITGKKKYTQYVENFTIKVSKSSFKDTVVTIYNTDYEKSFPETDIVLNRQSISGK